MATPSNEVAGTTAVSFDSLSSEIRQKILEYAISDPYINTPAELATLPPEFHLFFGEKACDHTDADHFVPDIDVYGISNLDLKFLSRRKQTTLSLTSLDRRTRKEMLFVLKKRLEYLEMCRFREAEAPIPVDKMTHTPAEWRPWGVWKPWFERKFLRRLVFKMAFLYGRKK
ncbi:hypothetical protein NA57DRAFT_73763 [Rhizodiscina lignyota]|uniref:Uncharacterized protein n=1 Tax=Rhizodiscina lignyota TaxID=1504668 RepID=A0A9P4IPU0_9PEZI|nr:hypothetical protein NA57DRAFT_73763 [Rhizodiscina lignyota]